MRYVFRASALAVIAALTTTILLLHPGAEPAAAAAEPATDVDLALVPTDAVGFIHVRAADLWKNEIFAGFRHMWQSAWMTSASSARWSPTSPSTPTPTTSSTAATANKGGRAW